MMPLVAGAAQQSMHCSGPLGRALWGGLGTEGAEDGSHGVLGDLASLGRRDPPRTQA
jgi:hypothetical protein